MLTAGRGDGRALVIALVRLGLIPVVLITESLIDHPGRDLEIFETVFPVACGYAVLAAVMAARARRPLPLAPFALVDMAFIALLTFASGGGSAQMRFIFSVPPIVAAFVGRPRHTAALAALSVAGYLAVCLIEPPIGRTPEERVIAVNAIDLAWRGALAVVMSAYLVRREDRIRQLAASRQKLVAQALGAEDRARRELAYVLHDEVVQSLLSAEQDLKAASRGKPGYLERATAALESTVGQLRHQIASLHPHQLDTLGLEAAVDQIAQEKARLGGFRPVVRIDEDAVGIRDDLILSLARELLQNAARHSGAEIVRL
ncbi:MAG: two-component system, NarL family, sensor kinase, partial [Solirubrobacteraceae bacterium]|nr:two-component system, NarL family, sensor kinase [Solirubrobacteraceae bacterium]